MLYAMTVSREQVFEVLGTIPDPEMPISIVDLGLVEDVRVVPPSLEGGGQGMGGARASRSRTSDSARSTHPPAPSRAGRGNQVEIDLLPTFIGCPALDMIAGDVRAKVGALPGVGEVRVNWLFAPPWSVDRITAGGRESLREHGVTVPPPGGGSRLQVAGHEAPQTVTLRTSAVPCPFCGSRSTYLDSPFGPTRCRTIYFRAAQARVIGTTDDFATGRTGATA
jgi:phenylacetate-CoA oxygenase PaaJ subunit